jgi:heptaprenyl diphosphate synthase
MKRFDQFRARRSEVYDSLFSARALCIAGLFAMPAMLFNPSVVSRVIQFLVFWFLCWLAGKKNRPLITITVTLCIVAFNLIVPHGLVLYSIGSFRITEGALMSGITRAVTLQGLIMLSRLSVRRDLKFPGVFGELIGESFRLFARIMDSKKRITRKNLMGDIDQLMIELNASEQASTEEAAIPATRTKAAGLVILAVVVILSWLLLVPAIIVRIFG